MNIEVAISGLSKDFATLRAVDDLSFRVGKGEVMGFLGPNGAGKSTTMKMITGFLAPTRGHIQVCGLDIQIRPIEVKQQIGYLPEGAPLYGDMTTRSFLHFIAEIRGFRGPEKRRRVDAVVDRIELREVTGQTVGTLSKGFKRRVGLAQAILHDPPVLILDEPTDGLDPNQKYEVRNLIREIASDKVIIISTHILEEVDAVCSRALIIAQGRLLADGTPDELQARSRYHQSIVVGFPPESPAHGEFSAAALGVSGVEQVQPEGADGTAWRIFPRQGALVLEEIRAMMEQRGWNPSRLFVEKGHLDDVFRELTRQGGAGNERGEPADG